MAIEYCSETVKPQSSGTLETILQQMDWQDENLVLVDSSNESLVIRKKTDCSYIDSLSFPLAGAASIRRVAAVVADRYRKLDVEQQNSALWQVVIAQLSKRVSHYNRSSCFFPISFPMPMRTVIDLEVVFPCFTIKSRTNRKTLPGHMVARKFSFTAIDTLSRIREKVDQILPYPNSVYCSREGGLFSYVLENPDEIISQSACIQKEKVLRIEFVAFNIFELAQVEHKRGYIEGFQMGMNSNQRRDNPHFQKFLGAMNLQEEMKELA